MAVVVLLRHTLRSVWIWSFVLVAVAATSGDGQTDEQNVRNSAERQTDRQTDSRVRVRNQHVE